MDKILLLKLLLTITTVSSIIISLYTIVPKTRKFYKQQKYAQAYSNVVGIVVLILLNLYVWMKYALA